MRDRNYLKKKKKKRESDLRSGSERTTTTAGWDQKRSLVRLARVERALTDTL